MPTALAGAARDTSDVALLELVEPPGWLPEPLELWPALRDPIWVDVLGYPVQVHDVEGVWRRFEVANPAAGADPVQLRWVEGTGTLPGHSGGPVLDVVTGTLAGILTAGSEIGRFDRYTPTRVAQNLWADLPRPWLAAGQSAREYREHREHFTGRSRGLRSGSSRREDLFRGRAAALTAATEWMRTTMTPRPAGDHRAARGGKVGTAVAHGAAGAGENRVRARVAVPRRRRHPPRAARRPPRSC